MIRARFAFGRTGWVLSLIVLATLAGCAESDKVPPPEQPTVGPQVTMGQLDLRLPTGNQTLLIPYDSPGEIRLRSNYTLLTNASTNPSWANQALWDVRMTPQGPDFWAMGYNFGLVDHVFGIRAGALGGENSLECSDGRRTQNPWDCPRSVDEAFQRPAYKGKDIFAYQDPTLTHGRHYLLLTSELVAEANLTLSAQGVNFGTPIEWEMAAIRVAPEYMIAREAAAVRCGIVAWCGSTLDATMAVEAGEFDYAYVRVSATVRDGGVVTLCLEGTKARDQCAEPAGDPRLWHPYLGVVIPLGDGSQPVIRANLSAGNHLAPDGSGPSFNLNGHVFRFSLPDRHPLA